MPLGKFLTFPCLFWGIIMKQHWVVAATLIDKACEMLRIQPGRKLIGVKKINRHKIASYCHLQYIF